MAEKSLPFSEKVMDHFRNPRNVGSMDRPDGTGKMSSPVCGDIMELYLKIKDDVIVDAKFKTFGCWAAIASSSMITEMVKGKSIEEALKLTNKDVADSLGGLPQIKMQCSLLAEDALRAAIKDYRKRKGENV